MDLAIIMGSSPQNSGEKKVQKITPFLWFDNQAEEAVNFYVSLFKNSVMQDLARKDQ
jgi:predicted 3-demethylubiquinone-9 3-methyltransferase (glyoxalase superfamily)